MVQKGRARVRVRVTVCVAVRVAVTVTVTVTVTIACACDHMYRLHHMCWYRDTSVRLGWTLRLHLGYTHVTLSLNLFRQSTVPDSQATLRSHLFRQPADCPGHLGYT